MAPSRRELLKLPAAWVPKTVALLWDAAKISSIDQLAEAIDAGRLAGLPRMGEKQIEKLRKGDRGLSAQRGRGSASTRPKRLPDASRSGC